MLRIFRRFQRPLNIYTDGSLKHGLGSWAFVAVRGDKVILENSGVSKRTTSNRMEFQAAIEALKHFSEERKIKIHTDSRVLLEAIAKIPEWQRLSWVKANQSKIPSVDQMKEIFDLIKYRNIEWQWVKAHTGIVFNERCDQLCIQARKMKF